MNRLKMLKSFLVVLRPVQCLTASMAVVATASLANGHFIWNAEICGAAVAMAFLVLAASLYHCSRQDLSQPFTRQVNDVVKLSNVQLKYLTLWSSGPCYRLSLWSMPGSVLPIGHIIVVMTIIALVYYTKHRGVQGSLNWLIGMVCSVPVMIGWGVSGEPLSITAVLLTAVTAWFYFLRESTKDSQESQEIQFRTTWYVELFPNGKPEEHLSGALINTGAIMTIALAGIFYENHFTEAAITLAPLLCYALFGFLAFIADKRSWYPQGIMTAMSWAVIAISVTR